MRITLVGMSGSGKSYWSCKLRNRGFRLFPCDDLIARRLFPGRQNAGNAVGFLGEWMGFPYQSGYEEREAEYLRAEIEVLSEVIARLADPGGGGRRNVVVDTTGSVIYAGEEILAELGRLTTVVHLSTPEEIQEKMLEAYLAKPRPVLWRGLYRKNEAETEAQALARCYSILLAAREEMYRRMAHLTVDHSQRTSKRFGIEEFLQLLAASPGSPS